MIIVITYEGLVEAVISDQIIPDDTELGVVDIGKQFSGKCPICDKLLCNEKWCHDCDVDWEEPIDSEVIRAYKEHNK